MVAKSVRFSDLSLSSFYFIIKDASISISYIPKAWNTFGLLYINLQKDEHNKLVNTLLLYYQNSYRKSSIT